tara:strand:- start:229 stop:864 length:636 start_codon:yes stop_codon:yes gene_type:complete
MRLILPLTLSVFTINFTLSASTYVTTVGSVQDILRTSGYVHPYSGENLSPFAYLPFADLYRADLSGADLYRANLTGANLARTDLTGADLFRAELTGANLYRANLTGANLARTDLTIANLYGANFYGAVLIGADFYASWLESADLSYADLTNVSNVNTAVWTNSNLFGATLPDGYDQAWFESEGAIFVVPEPSTYALLLGSLALGLVALRRR